MSAVARAATALVTGAGTGIGRAVATALLARGFRVAVTGRRREPLESLRAEGGSCLVVPADLRREDDVRRLVARIDADLGPLDVLVNNAGVAEFAPVAETSPEMWDETMAVNLRAPFLLTRAFLPGMLAAGRGHVVMIVSVAAMVPFPESAAYGASKAGLLGFTRVVREETRGKGVRVTAVIPGATDTPLWGTDGPDPRRLMPPEAVAAAVAWAVTSDPTAVPEEIVLRPPQGDL